MDQHHLRIEEPPSSSLHLTAQTVPGVVPKVDGSEVMFLGGQVGLGSAFQVTHLELFAVAHCECQHYLMEKGY